MRPVDLSAISWRKSSYSNSDGGACVEVSDAFTTAWRKSSYSNSDGGQCLEVSDDFRGTVPVRDSKTPKRAVLVFPADRWARFVAAVSGGRGGGRGAGGGG